MSTSLISARTAAARLAPVGLSREQARRVLLAGLAGPAQRAAGALLYDESAVEALAQRPETDQHLLRAACPSGIFLARLGRSRSIDVLTPWTEQAAVAGQRWHLSLGTLVKIRSRMSWPTEHSGSFPLLGTVGGFVAFGANITGFKADAAGLTDLIVEPPGGWFDQLRDHYHHSSRGRDWYLHAWPREPST